MAAGRTATTTRLVPSIPTAKGASIQKPFGRIAEEPPARPAGLRWRERLRCLVMETLDLAEKREVIKVLGGCVKRQIQPPANASNSR